LGNNYSRIVAENLRRLFDAPPGDLTDRLGAKLDASGDWRFRAFGKDCRMAPGGISLDGRSEASVLGVLLSLYALHASPVSLQRDPFRAFREFADSTPYHGAFAAHTEHILVPHVHRILQAMPTVRAALDGRDAPADLGGDGAVVVHPLPKIALCYLFYEADEDFPASVTCLFSQNADRFLPVDGLADVGEYTSRAMIGIVADR
jgi:hypothetical protein